MIEYITMKQVSVTLPLSRERIGQLVRAGTIARDGRNRYSKADVEAYRDAPRSKGGRPKVQR